VDPLRQALAHAYDVQLETPFVHTTKAGIAQLGAELEAPVDLSWSCYEGGTVHCGRCGTCVERAEAFHLAGVPDPTTYADPDYWRAAVAAAQAKGLTR
jgi:7-cyano-7-deazaguanine synthase